MIKCKIAVDLEADCQQCCLYCEKKETCAESCGELNKNCEEALLFEETELDVMKDAVPDVLRAITDIAIQKKKLDEQEKLMKQKILKAMEEHGVKSFENECVKFVYVAPTTRTTIDSTKLKKELPDVAEKYSKISNVSASVRITVK